MRQFLEPPLGVCLLAFRCLTRQARVIEEELQWPLGLFRAGLYVKVIQARYAQPTVGTTNANGHELEG